MAYMMLIERDHIAPAPYLARAKWVQLQNEKAMSDDDIKAYIKQAYSIIFAKLTKANQHKLGRFPP